MGARRTSATVTSPTGDRDGYESPAVALSAAISIANAAAAPGTFYVRDANGDGYGRVERDETGRVEVWRYEEVKR